MTTRKRPVAGVPASLVALVLSALGAAGCATPGPLHLYALREPGAATIADRRDAQTATWPSYLEAGDEVTGFAYDPYTDHFFLRLAPGTRIRVVDRPARAIKREFQLPEDASGADLALRPLSGHLYLLHAHAPRVLETTRLGKPVRTITLERVARSPAGIAYDAEHNHLLVLAADRQTISVHDLTGRHLRELRLERSVGPSLAFDSAERRFYAPSAPDGDGVAVFDDSGRWLTTEPLPARFVDVGQRSFVRVF